MLDIINNKAAADFRNGTVDTDLLFFILSPIVLNGLGYLVYTLCLSSVQKGIMIFLCTTVFSYVALSLMLMYDYAVSTVQGMTGNQSFGLKYLRHLLAIK